MILKVNSGSNSKQAVRALRLLLGVGVGDSYNAATQAAVKAYQKVRGLSVDGIAGPKTLAALCGPLPAVSYLDYSGSVHVKAVQALVGAKIDGKYGKQTRANVTAFQSAAGIAATGDVDANTWRALWDLDYTRTAKTSGTNTVRPVDYKQYDSRWGAEIYTSCGNQSQTIRNSGCGHTSMADIIATWIDSRITPSGMCKWSVNNGYRTASNGTAWAFFPAVAKAFGFSRFVQTKSMATARAALKEGALVVASMGPGYWTSGGHFICLWKTDDTYMYANDPASATRKKQKLGPFEEQRKQFFIFYRQG